MSHIDAKAETKTCNCGGDLCIGSKVLLPGFFCIREADIAALKAETKGVLADEKEEFSPRRLEILQHALGVDKYGRTPKGFTPYTRNYFCAGEGDAPDCKALVEAGLMVLHERTESMPYYNCSVSEAGKNAMHAACPTPPKLTRSQMRYQAFLDADSGETFGEWMKTGGIQ